MSELIEKPEDKELELPNHNPKTMFINPTNKYEIQQIIDKMKNDGIDKIYAKTLKIISPYISESLACILNICGSIQQKRATERARCLFCVKGALFNSLIIVCCVFEKKKPRTYIDRFFPALSNGAIVFIAKRFLPDENSS